MSDKNVEAVKRRLDEREAKGMATYGVTTDKAGLPALEWLQHFQDELLDGAVYAEQLKTAIKLIVKATREDCAIIAEQHGSTPGRELAETIRARGDGE